MELCIPPLNTFALLSPSRFHCSFGISLDHCCGLEDYVGFGNDVFGYQSFRACVNFGTSSTTSRVCMNIKIARLMIEEPTCTLPH